MPSVRRAGQVLFLIASAVAGAAVVGCMSTSQPISPANTPYAIIFGHVTTTAGSSALLIGGQAYLDSSSAFAGDSLFGGFSGVQLDAQGNYLTRVTDQAVQKLYFNIQAVSTRPAGRDSVLAVPVQLDSVGGTPPHDSLEIDFSLP
jgi:hypothetical protein